MINTVNTFLFRRKLSKKRALINYRNIILWAIENIFGINEKSIKEL